MFDWLAVLLIGTCLLALGFAAGYGYRRFRHTRLGTSFTAGYYQSLRYLLNDTTDSSMDGFLQSLEVNEQTLEIHMALGLAMRRRGEVGRAIQIHEHLLRAGKLRPQQRHEAQFELACDFISAGVLDRAENLLDELVTIGSVFTPDALKQLLLIYQSEREWVKAISTADKLQDFPRQLGANELALMRSHYCCELAQMALAAGNKTGARDHLNDAVGYCKQSVRASLLLAQLEVEEGNYSAALESLRRVPQQDADFIRESLPLLGKCFGALGDQEGYRRYLYELLARHPGASLILHLANLLKTTEGIKTAEGTSVAIEFISAQLALKPSLRLLNALLDLQIAAGEDSVSNHLSLMKGAVEKVLAEKPEYQCHKCGFSGKKLHWLCPSCKSWGSIRPIKGVTGE